jgi:Tfp pilus assembly protein PilV
MRLHVFKSLGSRKSRGSEAGFTLVEAIMATAILTVGLAAVSNLTFVAISSNVIGNRASTAAFLASQKMEDLRSTTFDSLADSPTNALDVDQTGYFQDDVVEKVGTFKTRWKITTVVSYGASLKYLVTRSQMVGVLGRQTRAEFTTLRSCTGTGCVP